MALKGYGFMNNEFLYGLQEDILDKKGYYKLYLFFYIPVFIITIENIKLYLYIFRIILSGLALVFLTLIYLKYKMSRNEHDNKVIIGNIILFFTLTLVCIYQVVKYLL